jgi:hypothetical protein
LLGTSPGIHPHHARRYFRRVQSPKAEALQRHFAAHNPLAVEESQWSLDRADVVLTFCVEAPAGALTKRDLGAVEFLEHVRRTQQNWVRAGSRPELGTQPWLTNNVSNTVMVRDQEWEEVAGFLYRCRADFAGVSLLPASGDNDYRQAPMCAVYSQAEIESAYGQGWRPARSLLSTARAAFDGDVWAACDLLLRLGDPIDIRQISSVRRHWLQQARACARRYFGNDPRQLSACLKDLANLQLWQRLAGSYQPVDYHQIVEKSDETCFLQEPACAGGACLV